MTKSPRFQLIATGFGYQGDFGDPYAAVIVLHAFRTGHRPRWLVWPWTYPAATTAACDIPLRRERADLHIHRPRADRTPWFQPLSKLVRMTSVRRTVRQLAAARGGYVPWKTLGLSQYEAAQRNRNFSITTATPLRERGRIVGPDTCGNRNAAVFQARPRLNKELEVMAAGANRKIVKRQMQDDPHQLARMA